MERLSDVSSALAIRNTRLSFGSLAYRPMPVGFLSPMRIRFGSFSPATLNATSIRGGASPYVFKSPGFSSTTRSCSRDAMLAATSDAVFWSAGNWTGLTMVQPAASFFSDVTSPDADFTSSWSTFVASAVKTFCLAFSSITGFLASMK